ncbi:pre-rRNA-processing protein TSR2 homolog [Nilaparvata lugens]|uniref:pre-rRNA-processing protein TSR2 homolog n=1 Tax=Nilaparvata lugens TaxID=108931 RepID=UPI00193CB5FA|nr:pre-rRNA-processing protein TSR2 homolog [Nilaparvata lugens]
MESAKTTEEKFETAVGIVFNNWTALKLCLEHGQGGNPVTAHEKLLALLSEIKARFAKDANLHWSDLADMLADHMDAEFDTLLEDESENEVASHICQLFQQLTAGNDLEVTDQLTRFPVTSSIFCRQTAPAAASLAQCVAMSDEQIQEASNCGVIAEEPEEVDPGWTVVKRR